ncbi:MAG: lipocalin family protein [Cyclobacteriaceae bacterium]
MLKNTSVFAGVNLLLWVAFGLSSCDNDDNPDINNVLIGTWQSVDLVISGCTDPANNDSFTFNCPSSLCATVEFTADGNYTLTTINFIGTDVINGTYTFSGNELTFCQDGDQSKCRTTVLTFSGNTLSGTFSSNPAPGCMITETFVKV